MYFSRADLYMDSNSLEINYHQETCPCDLYPFTPHFYIVKLGFTRVYIFSYFCSKTYGLWDSLEPAH